MTGPRGLCDGPRPAPFPLQQPVQGPVMLRQLDLGPGHSQLYIRGSCPFAMQAKSTSLRRTPATFYTQFFSLLTRYQHYSSLHTFRFSSSQIVGLLLNHFCKHLNGQHLRDHQIRHTNLAYVQHQKVCSPSRIDSFSLSNTELIYGNKVTQIKENESQSLTLSRLPLSTSILYTLDYPLVLKCCPIFSRN